MPTYQKQKHRSAAFSPVHSEAGNQQVAFADARNENQRLLQMKAMAGHSQLKPNVALRPIPLGSVVLQAKWDTSGVNDVLKKDASGLQAVKDLNAQNYTVLHYDSYVFYRQYYKDDKKTIKDGSPKRLEANGWHDRSKKEIAVSDRRNDAQAASTLVHEVAHANQHEANEDAQSNSKPLPFPDTLSKEVDAHIEQEKFNIAAGIAPKHVNFRKSGKIDPTFIKSYVEQLYAVGGKKRPYTNTKPVFKIIETIKPWPTPT